VKEMNFLIQQKERTLLIELLIFRSDSRMPLAWGERKMLKRAGMQIFPLVCPE
jgi:hypothetical protein